MALDLSDGRVYDLADLGLDVPAGNDQFDQMVGPETTDPNLLEVGSVAAHALHSFFASTPVTLVQSPPGAGKSTLVVKIVGYLLAKSDVSVHVVAPTNNAAIELATKICRTTGPGSAVVRSRGRRIPDEVATTELDGYAVADGKSYKPDRQVHVTTVHAAKQYPPEVDLLIVEEAYQVTYGLLAEAADNATQILMVGDPGQIGPVITHDLSPWRGVQDAPAARAPEVFARMNANILTLPCTYRIGQESTDAIAPLYPFTFHSERPERHLDGYAEIEALEVPTGQSATDSCRVLAARAARLVGTQYTDEHGTRALEQSDVCVVAARNELVAGTAALLASENLTGITVGTADSLQGGQWPAVVAIDPVTSAKQISGHAVDPGRLCVMTSRHMGHLTWVYSDGWQQRIDDYSMSEASRMKSLQVRATLTLKRKAQV